MCCKAKPAPIVSNITIKHVLDENPDTSDLGEYTDKLEPGVIVRCFGEFYEKLPAPMERDYDGRFLGKGKPYDLPSRGGREYRGFKPEAGGEKPGTADYYQYGIQDWKRMKALDQYDWYYMGITAKAEVRYQERPGGVWRILRFTSYGLWGIESDSDAGYLQSIEDEQLADLQDQLQRFGVDLSNFDALAKIAKETVEEAV